MTATDQRRLVHVIGYFAILIAAAAIWLATCGTAHAFKDLNPGVANTTGLIGYTQVKNFGGVGNCTNQATGVGCTDERSAFEAAVNSACAVQFSGNNWCTSDVYVQPGTHYLTALWIGPMNIGGLSALIGLHIICGGSNGGNVSGSPAKTTIVIAGFVPGSKVGIDAFGVASGLIQGCDIRTISTAPAMTGALLASGKTSACDCDVMELSQDVFTDWATDQAVILSDGDENYHVHDTTIFANGGQHGVMFSAANMGSTPGLVPETLRAPGSTLTMGDGYVDNTVIRTSGTATKPACAVYYDAFGANQGPLGGRGDDFQGNGVLDAGVCDGFFGASGTLPTTTIQGLYWRGLNFEGLNDANGTQRVMQLGSTINDPELAGLASHTTARASLTHADGVTNGTTAFTSALLACTPANTFVGQQIASYGATGIKPGTWIVACNGTSATLSQAAAGTGSGLTYQIWAPQLQFYGVLNSGSITGQMAAITQADVVCGSATQTWISVNNGGSIFQNCQGASTNDFAGVSFTGVTHAGPGAANITPFDIAVNPNQTAPSFTIHNGAGALADSWDSTGKLTTVPSPLSATVGGTGSTNGALSVWSCTFPDTDVVNQTRCPWSAPNSATKVLYLDQMCVSYNAACTTFPVFAVRDVSISTNSGTVAATNGTNNCVSFNGSIAGAAAFDTYAFQLTTAGAGCGATLATEFVTVTVTGRF